MITDRDIAVRGVGEGKGPETSVREVMTDHVDYCFEDQDVEEVTKNMVSTKVRRLPVLNREKRLVGTSPLGTSHNQAKHERIRHWERSPGQTTSTPPSGLRAE